MRVCVCSSVLAGSGGPASRARSGAPHLFLQSFCLPALLGPLKPGVAPFLVLCSPSPPLLLFFSSSVVVFLCAPFVPSFFCFRPRVPWALALCVVRFVGLALLGSPCALAPFVLPAWLLAALWWWPPPPPFCVSRFWLSPLGALCLFPFFSLLVGAPVVSGCLSFPAPAALGLGAVLFFSLPLLLGSPCALACLCPLLGRRVPPPPPPPLLCLAVFVAAARCLFFFLLLSAPPLSLAFSGFRPRVPWTLALCCVCFARLSVRSRLVCVSRLAMGCSLVVAAPLLCLAVFVAAAQRLVFFLSSCLRPRCLWLSFVFGHGCPEPWRRVLVFLLASRFWALCALPPLLCCPPGRWLHSGGCRPPAPLFVFCGFGCRRSVPFFWFFFFSLLVRAPVVSGFAFFPAPAALGLGAVLFLSLTLLLGSLCALGCLCLLLGRWLLPPPSAFVSCGFRRCCSVPFFFLLMSAPPLSFAFSGFRPRVPWALALCCVCFARLSVRSRLLCVSRLAVGCSLVVAAPPPFLCLAVFVAAARCLGFFFLLSAPPLSLAFSAFRPRVLWASALCVVCSVGLALLGSRCALASFVLPAWPLAAPWWLPPPSPPFLSRGFRRCRSVLCAVCCAVLCCVSVGAVLRRAAARCAAWCCAVVCCVVLLRSFGAAACCAVPFGAARRSGALCFAALCFAVLPRALCSVLCVFFRGVLMRAVVRSSALCCVCPGVLRCAFPVLSALCGVVLRCAGALAFCCSCGVCCCWRLVLWCAAVCCAVSFGVLWCGAGSGGPWLSAGGVFRCRCPCLAARSASLWLVWFAVVPCFPVSCSVVLCCRVVLCCCALLSFCVAVGACFALLLPVVLCCVVLLVGCAVFCPMVVSACCGALSLVLYVPCLLCPLCCCASLCWLWCPASLSFVLWRCAVAWCCAVVLCCGFAVLFVLAFPSCGLWCGTVLCCCNRLALATRTGLQEPYRDRAFARRRRKCQSGIRTQKEREKLCVTLFCGCLFIINSVLGILLVVVDMLHGWVPKSPNCPRS